MKVTIEITNQALYDKMVVDVDTSHLTGTDYAYGNMGNVIIKGNLYIELAEGWREYQGEFGQYDYHDDYGFMLKLVTNE